MGAQFPLPLQEVIPGQLIASTLWNGEWNNLSTNFIPAGMDSYSDTDAQMQIQTNPYPGGVTSHATSLGGEIERIRFQISAIIGDTTPDFWYADPPTDLTTISGALVPVGGLFPWSGNSTTPSSNFVVANGQAISRTDFPVLFTLYNTMSPVLPWGIGDGTTTFNVPNVNDTFIIGAGGTLSPNAAGTGGAQTVIPGVTDPGHTHTQDPHSHTDSGHTHSTPNHTHTLATSGADNNKLGGAKIIIDSSQNMTVSGASGGAGNDATSNTTSGGGSTSGSGSASLSSTAATENSNTTGLTVNSINIMNPFVGMFWLVRAA